MSITSFSLSTTQSYWRCSCVLELCGGHPSWGVNPGAILHIIVNKHYNLTIAAQWANTKVVAQMSAWVYSNELQLDFQKDFIWQWIDDHSWQWIDDHSHDVSALVTVTQTENNYPVVILLNTMLASAIGQVLQSMMVTLFTSSMWFESRPMILLWLMIFSVWGSV